MQKPLFFILIFLLSACAARPATTPAATSSAPVSAPTATISPSQAPVTAATEVPQTAPTATAVKDVSITVVKPDGHKMVFKLDDLKKLPLANVTVSGKTFEGYKIKDILTAAGVTTFLKVTITGDNEKIKLDPSSVDDNTILSISDSGTLKLVSTNLSKQFWPQNVTLIIVQ